MKSSNDGRHLLQLATSCTEFVSNNTEENVESVVCEATIFLLFWLHLDSQSFKIVRKFYCKENNKKHQHFWKKRS